MTERRLLLQPPNGNNSFLQFLPFRLLTRILLLGGRHKTSDSNSSPHSAEAACRAEIRESRASLSSASQLLKHTVAAGMPGRGGAQRPVREQLLNAILTGDEITGRIIESLEQMRAKNRAG